MLAIDGVDGGPTALLGRLDLIHQQAQAGVPVIRRMTAEERRRYPPRSAPLKRSWRR